MPLLYSLALKPVIFIPHTLEFILVPFGTGAMSLTLSCLKDWRN
nr:hypothetical protein [Nostoc sp. DedQUE03]